MTTYTENCSRSIAGTSVGVFDSLIHVVRNWFEIQMLKSRIQHERKQLLAMDAGMLHDIGISPAQAKAEALRADIPQARIKSAGKIC